MLRIVAAWSAVALVSWQAAASVHDVGIELGRKPFRLHVRGLTASPEELIRAKLGKDFAIWRALREHVPHDGHVLVSFATTEVYAPSPENKALRRRKGLLGALAYPQTLEGWAFAPRSAAREFHGKEPRQEYVLDLESGRDYSVWPLCEELARGPGFRLLIVGNSAR